MTPVVGPRGDRRGNPNILFRRGVRKLARGAGWISHAEFRASHLKLSASLKKSTMKRLVWLEAQRERLHGVPAPDRGRF